MAYGITPQEVSKILKKAYDIGWQIGKQQGLAKYDSLDDRCDVSTNHFVNITTPTINITAEQQTRLCDVADQAAYEIYCTLRQTIPKDKVDHMGGYQMIYQIVETRGRYQVAKAKPNLNLDFQIEDITGLLLRKFRVYMSARVHIISTIKGNNMSSEVLQRHFFC